MWIALSLVIFQYMFHEHTKSFMLLRVISLLRIDLVTWDRYSKRCQHIHSCPVHVITADLCFWFHTKKIANRGPWKLFVSPFFQLFKKKELLFTDLKMSRSAFLPCHQNHPPRIIESLRPKVLAKFPKYPHIDLA